MTGEGPGLLAQLRRRWWLVVLTTLLAAGAAFAIVRLRAPTYSASTILLVQPSSPEATVIGAAVPADSGSQTRSAATIAAVAAARPVAERTARVIGGGLTANQVGDRVKAVADQDANVLRVTATEDSGPKAARLANVFASQFQAEEAQRQRGDAQRARQSLQRRYQALPSSTRRRMTGQDLRDQIQRLRALESVGSGEISIVEQAHAPTTSNAHLARSVLLGALFGVLLGAGVALLRDQRDRRVRSDDDLESALDLPVLAQVPDSAKLRRATRIDELAPAESEAFRLLWARLRFGQKGGPVRRVLVTSPGAQEGKSLVSWYLACVAAESGARVLVVEADARRPVLAERHGLGEGGQLAGLVNHGATLRDAVSAVAVTNGGPEGAPTARMDVLVAGGERTSLTSMQATERLLHLLREEVDAYDLVVVDTPPITLAAETIPLSTAVDGVLIVSRSGRTSRDGLVDVRGQLARLEAPALGIVRDGGAVPDYYG